MAKLVLTCECGGTVHMASGPRIGEQLISHAEPCCQLFIAIAEAWALAMPGATISEGLIERAAPRTEQPSETTNERE